MVCAKNTLANICLQMCTVFIPIWDLSCLYNWMVHLVFKLVFVFWNEMSHIKSVHGFIFNSDIRLNLQWNHVISNTHKYP